MNGLFSRTLKLAITFVEIWCGKLQQIGTSLFPFF